MAIERTVETDVYCDVCGEWIMGWKSMVQELAEHGRQNTRGEEGERLERKSFARSAG